MRTHRSGQATVRRGTIRSAFAAPLAGVVALLGGLGFLLAPAAPSAAASPHLTPAPAQGWTSTEAPLPTDSGTGATNPNVYLASSTCPVANGCVSVGWYDDTNGKTWGLIEQQNQTSWTYTEAPEPSSNAGHGADQAFWFGSQECGYNLPCRAVSCPTATSCVAVGEYEDTAGYYEPAIDTLANGTWTSVEGPLPSDTATDAGPTNFPDAYYFSAACTSTTSCVAVGRYRNTSGDYMPLIATLSGTTWSAPTVSLPSPNQGETTDYPPSLTGVSCASASVCVASGSYLDGAGYRNGLLEVLSNGTWTAVQAPQPPGAGTDADTDQQALVAQVVCPSTTSCTGVGFYYDDSDQQQVLIESWNGSTWTPTEGQAPSGAKYPELGAISCPTATFCVATGAYEDSSSATWGLIETFSGGTWTGTQAPQPAAVSEALQYAQLWEVACPTPNFCLVPGQYDNSSNVDQATVLQYSGGTWSAMVAPVPSSINATLNSYGRTVACDSPVACVLGGQFYDSHSPSNEQGFLDTWTGAQGYWLGASDGGIFGYGNTGYFGSRGGQPLNKPIVGMASTFDGQGYWFAASDGGVFNYGDAGFFGSVPGALKPGQMLTKPIVGMAGTPDGKGYWLVASDGGVFGFGDAHYFGGRGGQPLNKPVVGMAATPDGQGYWLVASDGGIFGYGDAQFYGSSGNIRLNMPVVGMAASPDGLGYWLVASDGGIFNYGDALFWGSAGNLRLNAPVVGMASSPSGQGYQLVASDGGTFNYGDAGYYGGHAGQPLNKPVVGMAGG